MHGYYSPLDTLINIAGLKSSYSQKHQKDWGIQFFSFWYNNFTKTSSISELSLFHLFKRIQLLVKKRVIEKKNIRS